MARRRADTEATRVVAAPVKGVGEPVELPALPEAEGAEAEGAGLDATLEGVG